MDYPAFCGGSYPSQSFIADNERTVNMYSEPMEVPGAATRMALYPTPGVTVVANLNGTIAGAGRAHYFDGAILVPGSGGAQGREFAVIGQDFVEIFDSGVVVSRGTVANDGLPATISSNGDGGDEIFVTSGTNGYIFNRSSGVFTQIAALNGKANFGAYLDGYFLALDTSSSTLYISVLLDGLTWNTGTDFAQRSLAPDPWVSMKVLNRYIWLFGSLTSEVWYNVAATFPFAPHPSGLLQYGCLAPFSPAVCGDVICWLGSSIWGINVCLRAQGFTVEPISTFAFQKALSEYTNPNNGFSVTVDGQGDSYAQLGHSFYVLSFPFSEHTWVYDLNTGIWHERGTWDPDENEYNSWLPRWATMAFGEVRILHALLPYVYKLDPNETSDAHLPPSTPGLSPKNSGPIRRLRRAPILYDENERIFFSEFELFMEPGLGDHTAQGTDPQIMLRISNDAGKTFGPELWTSAGKQGEYATRANWHRLGMARRRIFEIVFADPVPFRIIGASFKLAQPAQIKGTRVA